MDIGFLNFLKGSKATTRTLIAAILEAVDAGTLLPGDMLPSTREIGLFVGASRTTVARAFTELVGRGYLEATKGSGTRVSQSRPIIEKAARFSSQAHERSFSWSHRMSQSAIRLVERTGELTTSADIDELSNGALPPDLLPAREWRRLMSGACQSALESRLSSNKEVFGYEPLRRAIAQLLRRTQGIMAAPEQIVLYSGAQSALTHLMDLMVLPGQTAFCENPGYQGAREQFSIHGALVLPAAIDTNGIITTSLAAISGPVDWLHVSPSCQDPTGAVLSESRRHQLLAWCQTNGTAIIEDGWDTEFQYSGRPLPPLFSLDRTGSVIYLYNFWRVLFPLCSVGVLVLPERLIPVFEASKHLGDRMFPTVEHRVLTELIESGYLDHHLRTLWKTFRKRRQALIFELKQSLKDSIIMVGDGAGQHLLCRLRDQWLPAHILQAAREAGLPLVTTEPYYFGAAPANEFLIYFADVPCEQAQPIANDFAARLGIAQAASTVASAPKPGLNSQAEFTAGP